MLRGYLGILFMFVYLLIPGLPALVLILLVSLFSKDCSGRLALLFVQSITRLTNAAIGIKVRVLGAECVPKDVPVFFMANHRSYFDIFAGYPLMHGICGCVAKKEWLRIPFVSIWGALLHCVFLDRSNARAAIKTYDTVEKELRAGHNFWVFPEGTRGHQAELLPFKKGCLKPALRVGCPIVPMTLVHTDDVYELHRPIVRGTEILVHFHPPIYPDKLSDDEKKGLIDKIRQQIQDDYTALMQETK